jgi:hypothetical protein
MFQKMKNFWANPYAAPLTGAVGGIIEYARKPINNFIKGCEYAFDDNNYRYDDEQRGKMSRLFDRAEKYESGFGIIAVGGSVVGTLAFGGAGIAAGIALAGGVAAKVAAATVLGFAFAGVGAVAGPFIVAGVFATAGAMVGLGIGMVPGFFKGCKTALQHHKDLKTQEAVASALPKAQAQDAELTKNLAAVMQHFNNLPKEHKASFVRMMNEKYEQAAPGAQAGKALALIDAMPEKDREIFVRALRERLNDDFNAVAQKDVVLQAPVATIGTIKLKGAAPDV